MSSKSNSLTRIRNRNFHAQLLVTTRKKTMKIKVNQDHITFVHFITWNHVIVFSSWRKSFYLVRHKQILSTLNNWYLSVNTNSATAAVIVLVRISEDKQLCYDLCLLFVNTTNFCDCHQLWCVCMSFLSDCKQLLSLRN